MQTAPRWCLGKGNTFVSRLVVLSYFLTQLGSSNNIRGQWKRAFTSATSIGGGSIGGIIATTVFRGQDAPDYLPGLLAAMLANGLIVVIASLLTLKFNRANKRVDTGGKPIEGQIGFKYTY